MEDSRPNVRRCKESLDHCFTDFEKSKLAGILAELCQQREAAVLAKQRAMSAHGAEIKRIEELVAERTRSIMTGSEKRMIDCEWHMHDPREGYKTLYRLDTGALVTTEEMTFAERQGSLFPDAKLAPEQPREWPKACEDGAYAEDGAEGVA